MQCRLCNPGSYLLTRGCWKNKTSAWSCQPCPAKGATCPGFNEPIQIKQRQWALDAGTPLSGLNLVPYTFGTVAVPFPGSKPQEQNLTSLPIPTKQCAEGYQGLACTICSPDYYPIYALQCTRCPITWRVLTTAILGSIGQVLLFSFSALQAIH